MTVPFYTYRKDAKGIITLDLRGTRQSVACTLRRLQGRTLTYTVSDDYTDYLTGKPMRNLKVTVLPQ